MPVAPWEIRCPIRRTTVPGTTERCIYPVDHEGDCDFAPLDSVPDDAPLDPLDYVRDEHPDLAAELAAWWRQSAENEIAQTVAKAVEYSGAGGGLPQDLVDNGRQIAFVQRRERDFTDAELAEIGVWAYLVGKINRWSSALRNGQPVSDDTLLDIGVYVRIAQRIRQKGQWP
jgi:hypothetical protein